MTDTQCAYAYIRIMDTLNRRKPSRYRYPHLDRILAGQKINTHEPVSRKVAIRNNHMFARMGPGNE